jgi:hypothetical protein
MFTIGHAHTYAALPTAATYSGVMRVPATGPGTLAALFGSIGAGAAAIGAEGADGFDPQELVRPPIIMVRAKKGTTERTFTCSSSLRLLEKGG